MTTGARYSFQPCKGPRDLRKVQEEAPIHVAVVRRRGDVGTGYLAVFGVVR